MITASSPFIKAVLSFKLHYIYFFCRSNLKADKIIACITYFDEASNTDIRHPTEIRRLALFYLYKFYLYKRLLFEFYFKLNVAQWSTN